MKVYFNLRTRLGMKVAYAIAEEVINNTSLGHPFSSQRKCEARPTLMGIQCSTFRFEGGTVVHIELIEMNQENKCLADNPERWVITSATVKFYARGDTNKKSNKGKVVQTWDHKKLKELQKIRKWNYPLIRDKKEVTPSSPKS